MKIKAVITKPHGNFKVGDQVEVTAEEFAVLASEGLAITLSEHQASEAVKAKDASIKANDKSRIEQAVVRAKARNGIEAKDDAVLAKHLAHFEKGAPADMIVEFIDAIPGKDEKVLATQTTAFQQDLNGHSPSGRVQLQGVDVRDAAIKACDIRKPIDGLVRGGKIKEAIALSSESSIILASHIMPMVKAGQDFMLKDVVRAADVTDANVGTIAGSLVLMRNLGFLKNMINFMPFISTDLRNEPALFNQPVFSRYITPPAITSYNTTTGWADSTPSATDVTVTMNKHNGVQITFNTQLLGSTVRALFAEQLGAQTYALGEQVVKDFLTALFGATWTGTVNAISLGDPANFNLKSFVTLKNRMTLAKLPAVGRFGLFHPVYHDAVLQDSNLVTAKAIMSLINKDISAIESGDLPMIYGIKPLESQLALATNGTLGAASIGGDGSVSFGANNQVGFLGNMASMLMVARVPQDYTQAFKDIPATAAIEVVTDPDSGLSMLNCKYVNHQLASVTNRLSLMYGFAQGDPRQGIILKP